MRKLLVELTNVIDIPDINVPLEEVLAFRERRRSELLALRSYIDALYAGVKANIDDSMAMVAAVDKLAAAVADQRRTISETGWATKATGLFLDIKLTDFGSAAAAGVAAYGATNDLIAASKAAMLGVGVKFAAKMSAEAHTPAEMKYIISVEREFGKRHVQSEI